MRISVLKMAKICLFFLLVGVNSAPLNLENTQFIDLYEFMQERHITILKRVFGKLNHIEELLEMQAKATNQGWNALHAFRCGMEENVNIDSKWIIENITYKITQYPKIPPKINIDETIQRAFDTWADVTNLRFEPRKRNYKIEIKFVSEEHGDGYPFDGPYNIVGHAFAPGDGGNIHFDEDEEWSLDGTGVDLYQSAVHEIGHSLGLEHVNGVSDDSVMVPQFMHENYSTLSEFDVESLQSLYGVRKNSFITRYPFNRCIDLRFSTIFRTSDDMTYVFVNEKYLMFNENMRLVDIGLLTEKWKNLPANIDAATELSAGQMVFFKGNQFWKYTNGYVDQDYPRSLRNFDGVPDNIDSIMFMNGRFYFFKGGNIYIYFLGTRGGAVMSTITNTLNINTDFFNAAVLLDNSILFFKCETYFEYNLDTGTSTEMFIEDYFNC